MKAVRIKMKPGCGNSNYLDEIDMIYITGCDEDGFYKKSVIHDYLKNHPRSIQVDIYPFPDLQPMISSNGEKYVRSEPDATGRDNLLKLPRC